MEKRNKTAFEQLINTKEKVKDNWEETERGKNFNILIPAAILEMDLTPNLKIVLGFIYSVCEKRGYVNMTNKRISRYLCLTENTISTTMKELRQLTFIQKTDKGDVLSSEVQQTIQQRKDRTILIPFEVFNSKLPPGAKILWGEYNSLSKGKKPYYASREYTSKRLNMNKSSISNWTTLLYDNDYLQKNDLYSGYKFKKRIIITKIFERSKKDDYNKEIEEQ